MTDQKLSITYEMIDTDATQLTSVDIIADTIPTDQLEHFINIHKTMIQKNGTKVINYTDRCSKLYNSDIGKLYQINNIANRFDKDISTYRKLLFMNFKSHNIFYETNRTSLFTIIDKTTPDFICLTEALVPISIAETANNSQQNVGESSAMVQDLLSDRALQPDEVKQPYKAYAKFTEFKKNTNLQEEEKIKEEPNVTLDDDGGLKPLRMYGLMRSEKGVIAI